MGYCRIGMMVSKKRIKYREELFPADYEQQVVEYVVDLLNRQQSVALAGLRGVGLTSLLRFLVFNQAYAHKPKEMAFKYFNYQLTIIHVHQ